MRAAKHLRLEQSSVRRLTLAADTGYKRASGQSGRK